MYEEYEFIQENNGILKNNEYIQDNLKINIPQPTELRISTMTAVSTLSTSINLVVLGKYLKTRYDDNDELNKIEYMMYGETVRGVHPKGTKKNKGKKPFYNQATVIIKLDEKKYVNVKIFVNGNLQVTGLKSKDDGEIIFDTLIRELTKTHGIIKKEKDGKEIDIFEKAIEKPEDIKINEFDIMLINSDYFCGYKIEREMLYKIMIQEYGLFSTFEPCIYPGVNIKYYWNNQISDPNYPGVCQCSTKCSGKGDGNGNGHCKKITISAFQSGNVIITGARNLDQIQITYNFINKIFKKYYKELKKIDIPEFDDLYLSDELDDDNLEKKKKKNKSKVIMIKKSKIKKREPAQNYIENPLLFR